MCQRKQQAEASTDSCLGLQHWKQRWQLRSLQFFIALPEQNHRGGEKLPPSSPNSQPGEMPLQLILDRDGVHVSWEGMPQAGSHQILTPPMCQTQSTDTPGLLTLPALALPGGSQLPPKSFILQFRDTAHL